MSQYLNQERGVFTDFIMRIYAALKIEDPMTLVQSGSDRTGSIIEARLASILQPMAERQSTLCFVLIGSRAKGSARKYSDWDVGVTAGAASLGTDLYLSLKSEFEDRTDDFAQQCDLPVFSVTTGKFQQRL